MVLYNVGLQKYVSVLHTISTTNDASWVMAQLRPLPIETLQIHPSFILYLSQLQPSPKIVFTIHSSYRQIFW